MSCAPASASSAARNSKHYVAGARATLPVLLGIIPFGVITGVAMVASVFTTLIINLRFMM